MILVYGAILMRTQCRLGKVPATKGVHFADDYDIGIGGKGAIQSIATIKASTQQNVKVALIGQTGDDYYGKNIRLRLRQNGVITSALARHETLPTGSLIEIGHSADQRIIALGASQATNHEQVPMEILNKNNVLLVQDEFPAEQNIPVIDKAFEAETTVIFNCGERHDFTEYDLSKINYIITRKSAEKAVEYLTKNAPEKLIILDAKGDHSTFDKTGKRTEHPAPTIDELKWIDPACSEDAFCGAFTAAISEKRDIEESLTRAQITRILTASQKGGRNTLPYPDAIKDALESLK